MIAAAPEFVLKPYVAPVEVDEITVARRVMEARIAELDVQIEQVRQRSAVWYKAQLELKVKVARTRYEKMKAQCKEQAVMERIERCFPKACESIRRTVYTAMLHSQLGRLTALHGEKIKARIVFQGVRYAAALELDPKAFVPPLFE